MYKFLVALVGIFGVSLVCHAASGGAVLATGTVRIASSAAAGAGVVWATNTAYTKGQLVKIGQFSCIVETNGTSGATAPSVNLASSFTDNTVRWRACLRDARKGLIVQNWSTNALYISFGPKVVTAAGVGLVGTTTAPGTLALAGPGETPQDEIYASATAAGTVYTILEW